jgi:hypothetical protein
VKFKALIILIIFAFTFCKKDKKNEDPLVPGPPPDSGPVKVSFKGMADASDLVYNTKYTNLNGDTFQVQVFKYYISNVVLTRLDGSKYYEQESHHLIDHGTGKTSFTLANVPTGTYKSMSYIIGVDSLHNVSGAQDGDLSPSYGMYWPWLGYTMLTFEGHSPQASSIDKTLVFHIGGYSGSTNAIQSCSLNFAQDLAAGINKAPELKLKTNVCELFKNPNTYDFPSTYDITSPGIRANGFASNYADMISFDVIIP